MVESELEVALDSLPDLVTTDLMMPVLGGVEPFDATVLAQCIRDVADRAAGPQVDDAPAIA
jgi:CheY-like chemotaxis protein